MYVYVASKTYNYPYNHCTMFSNRLNANDENDILKSIACTGKITTVKIEIVSPTVKGFHVIDVPYAYVTLFFPKLYLI